MKCKRIWQPNFDDSKSIKKGYVWRCFCCGNVRKTTPKEMNERIEQGKEPSIEDVKKHMKETNNESFYQAREEMRNEEYGTLPPGYSSWGMYWKSR